MLVGHRGRCLLTLEVNKQQGGLSDQRLQCMCLWIRCPWGNVTSIDPFDWRLELQWSPKTAFLAILSNNCIFKICSWYQLSNFKVLLGKMTVQNFTQLNPAIPKILFLTLWQRTMWAAIFVLDSVLSFPLPQRCSSFIQLKLWYKANSASSLKRSKHNVYAKLLLELYRTMDIFSHLPLLNWHFKTLMNFFIVHGSAFLEVFVTGEHFSFMQPAPFFQICFACLPLPGFEWETQALWVSLSGRKGLTLLQNPIPTAKWSNVILMEHSSRELVKITLHLYSVCIQWSLSELCFMPSPWAVSVCSLACTCSSQVLFTLTGNSQKV